MEFIYSFFRILLFSVKRFFEEKRLLWAASLTYTTVFSLIPLLSVLFFVFNIFGSIAEIKTMVQPYIYKTLAPWAQEKVVSILNEMVSNIDFSSIGFFSASLLIISIFLLLFEIEYALNEIWLIKVKQSALSRAAIYWVFLTIVPVVIALSLFIFFTLQAYIPLKFIEIYINSHGVALLSYVLILSAFTIIYYLMPAAPVSFASAAFGGLIAATLWKLSGIAFNIYASRFFFYYPKIFGSLAAIPLFLLWIFLCWLLFLFGAEIVYMHQNRFFYRNTPTAHAIEGNRRTYYLLLVYLFVAREYSGLALPVSLKKIAVTLQIPLHIVQELLGGLLRSGILAEAKNKKNTYVPEQHFFELPVAKLLASIQKVAVPAECLPSLKNNPLHEAAISLLKTNQSDGGAKTMREILPLLGTAPR